MPALGFLSVRRAGLSAANGLSELPNYRRSSIARKLLIDLCLRARYCRGGG